MKKSQAVLLRKKIDAYCDATVADSWAGSVDPEDREVIAENLATAEQKLSAYVAKLAVPDNLGKQAVAKLQLIDTTHDTEVAHYEADIVLCDLLTALGYGDVVKAFNNIDKWYS